MKLPTKIVAILLALSIALSGCGTSRDPSLPTLVPVTGTVLLDGKPLANALVYFGSDATGSTGSSAATDEQGKYELTTLHNGVGAPVGHYTVIINKFVKPDGSDLPTGGEIDLMSTPHKELLPTRYSDVNLTTLKADVPEGGTTVNFELTSK